MSSAVFRARGPCRDYQFELSQMRLQIGDGEWSLWSRPATVLKLLHSAVETELVVSTEIEIVAACWVADSGPRAV